MKGVGNALFSCRAVLCAAFASGSIAADEPRAVLLYASDESRAVQQELENLCSTLEKLRWRPPTFVVLPDKRKELLAMLGRMEEGNPVRLETRKTVEANVERWFVQELVQIRNSRDHGSSALRQCSLEDASAVERAVGLEEIPRQSEPLLHYSTNYFRAQRRVDAGTVAYDPEDANVLIASLVSNGGPEGHIEVSATQATQVTLKAIREGSSGKTQTAAAALQSTAQRCTQAQQPARPLATAYFCDVPPGRYTLKGQFQQCGAISQEVTVAEHWVKVKLDCTDARPPFPWVWVSAAGGVAMVGGILTAVYYADAKSKWDLAEAACTPQVTPGVCPFESRGPELSRAAKGAGDRATAFSLATLVAVAAGTAITLYHFYGVPPEHGSNNVTGWLVPEVDLQLSPTVSSLILQGSF